jgi:hypothetical protein
MGLQDFVSSTGFLGTRIVTIWETFHWPGKYPVLRTLSNSWVIAHMPTSGSYFNILPVIRSYPGVFFGRSQFTAVCT